MNGQVSRGSAGEYQADEWAGIAWTDAQEEYDITPAPYVYGSGVAAE